MIRMSRRPTLRAFAVALLLASIGCNRSSSYPRYTMQVTESTHPGYQRSTLTSGSRVYVNDYDEVPMLAINTPSWKVMGELSDDEGDKTLVYEIPGQSPNDYVLLAGGMYPLGVFRNNEIPPFNWRAAKFREMEFAALQGPAAHKRTTDSALIGEVVQSLGEAKSAGTLPANPPPDPNTLTGIYLRSDELPGITFSPHVYFDKQGQAYLGFWNPASPEWVRAGPLFSEWIKNR